MSRGRVSLVVVAALVLGAGAVGAQERTDSLPPAPETPSAGDLESYDPAERGPREEPALPPPPPRRYYEFRVGPAVSGVAWEDDAAVDDGALAGFLVERDVASFLALRAGLGYGTTEISTEAVADAGPVETRLYLPEVGLLLQPWGDAADWPVRPYALFGFGSLVADADQDGISTRSQNTFGLGAGARVRLGRRLGLLGEIERYLVKLEDPFDPTREARSVNNTRFGGSLTYAF